MQNSAATTENGMVGPQEIKSSISIWSINSTCEFILRKNLKQGLEERYFHTHVHRALFMEAEKVDAAQVPTDG